MKQERNKKTSIARLHSIKAVTKGLVSRSRSPNKLMRLVKQREKQVYEMVVSLNDQNLKPSMLSSSRSSHGLALDIWASL